jgi:PST family polysaccharide transporter
MRFEHSRELFSFSIWLTLSQIANTINWNLDQLLIGKFTGKSELGYYTVGNNRAVMPTREATTPLTGTLFPAFSALADQPERLVAAYQRSQSLVTAIALPAGIGMALIADPFVRLTMGEKWLPAIIVIQILAAVFAFQTLGSLSQPLAMACGQTKLLFKRDMQAFFYRVPFIVVGVYFGGLVGVLYARAFVGVTSLVFNTNVVTKIIGLSFCQQMRPNIRALASSACMALVVVPITMSLEKSFDHITNIINLAILVAAGAIAYGATTMLLWRAMGRPNGPETEIIKVLAKALSAVKKNKQNDN